MGFTGLAVMALVLGVGMALRKPNAERAEERLDELAHGKKREKDDLSIDKLLKAQAFDLPHSSNPILAMFSAEGLHRLYEQADVGLPFRRFLLIALGLAMGGAAVGWFLKLPLLALPLSAGFLGVTPFGWLWLRKRKRVRLFTSQLPDALELVGRALRAGHGLASGLHVVASEMPAPISVEFGRVFEEQNLGIALEEALRGLADRVPTMDVRFFVTAVVIQRATGGDLAEILDKIGRLIRERFQILGQVQALTGEGRISGAVLMAMPPSLLAFCYMLNPGYAGLLFTDPTGKKMLAVAAVLQVLGALAIKKIVAIKI
jgi:tight adherence protein B